MSVSVSSSAPLITPSSIVTLTNGLRVANFSSPHPFLFEDGTALAAHSPENAERLALKFEEVITNQEFTFNGNTAFWQDLQLHINLTDEVWETVQRWITVAQSSEVDVVIVPMAMLEPLRRWGIVNGPFRSIRMKSRTEKVCCIDRFCQ